MNACARLLIRLCAVVVPRSIRARWREEWLGELEEAGAHGVTAALTFALGAPRDAAAARRGGLPADRRSWRRALWSDVRHAWRQIARRPAHTVTVIACVIAGLTASVGTLSVVTSLLYGDQPGIHARRGLVRVYLSYDGATGVETVAGGAQMIAQPFSVDDFRTVRDAGTPALESFGVEGTLPMTCDARHGPISTKGAFASGEFFAALRTEALLGRLIDNHDDRPDAPAVAVVSEYFWRTQMDASTDAIGSTVLVADRSFTVIGVTPRRFHGLQAVGIGEDEAHATQLWIPFAHTSTWPHPIDPSEPWLTAIGRMAGGITSDDVRASLTAPVARIGLAWPDRRGHATPVLRPHGFGPGDTPATVLGAIALILALPMTVLAIGCANVANLQLARVSERAREIAVRVSLGATRLQVIRLITIETLVVASAAVLLSIGVVALLVHKIQPIFPTEISIDWRVAAFAGSLAIAMAFSTGLLPAWLALRREASADLKHAALGGNRGHARLRSVLITAQIALSLALLSCAVVLWRTTGAMTLNAPAASREQLVATFDPAELSMSPDAARAFAGTLADRAAADPRALEVSLSQSAAVSVGPAAARESDRLMTRASITPSWLDVMDARVLAGRRLTPADRDDVALLSARAAGILTPDGRAIGKVLRMDDGRGHVVQAEVVGVVDDIWTRPTVERPDPVIYSPFPDRLTGSFTLRVRTRTPDALSGDLRVLVAAIDRRAAWTSLERGDAAFFNDAAEMRYVAWAVAACGMVALLLSATGLYAVVSYVVTLRRREIGLRLAIGADPRRIVGFVVRQAFGLALAGTAVGLVLAIALAFGMRASFVAPVNALDPLAYAPIVIGLMVVTLIAAAVPAGRAAAIDPIQTLRQD